jgi:hypothetical protein
MAVTVSVLLSFVVVVVVMAMRSVVGVERIGDGGAGGGVLRYRPSAH